MRSSRTWMWLVVLVVIAATVLFFLLDRNPSERPGAPSPHAIDQDQ